MKISITVEYDYNGHVNYLEVELEAEPVFENDSYSDGRGLVKSKDYPALNTAPSWDRAIYTSKQNYLIATYLEANAKEIEELFCEGLLDEVNCADY